MATKDRKVIENPVLLDFELSVSTLVSDTLMINLVLKSCVLCIEGRELLADLMLLDIHEFDVILGMDWFASHHASVPWFEKKVVFRPLGEPKFLFKASCLSFVPRMISCIQATRLLRKGCQGFLASVGDLQSKELEIGDIPLVQEFSDVFLEDLPRLPPNHEVEFSIDLLLGTAPISKVPY